MPSSEKCAELQSLDEQGWCPLHYAARHYSSDLLCAALDVDEGVCDRGSHERVYVCVCVCECV